MNALASPPVHHSIEAWIGFHAGILALLVLDLGFLNRKSSTLSLGSAIGWSLFWIFLSLLFAAHLFFRESPQAAVEYLTGYVVEKSLSVDNLFVFLVIFDSMKIRNQHQHRLLYWGIFGALLLRGTMIAAGAELLEKFHALIFAFGAFLVFTGSNLLRGKSDAFDPKKGRVFKAAQRFMPLSSHEYGGRFWVRESGRVVFTTAFVALLMIESSDVLFALDSVPAVFGVTRDPYIVYTSNVFAILGMRSLFFVLEDLLRRFHHLQTGLALILLFVGFKMLLDRAVHLSSATSLGVILSLLVGSALASRLGPQNNRK